MMKSLLPRTLAKIATTCSQSQSTRWIASSSSYYYAASNTSYSYYSSSSSKRSAKQTPNNNNNNNKPQPQPEEKAEKEKEWAMPSRIPYQSKVANAVSLSGYIHMPVQFEAASDGKFWAGTVLSHNPSPPTSLPPLWIPIIFEGDLAHIAACHLKENDHVYIDGQLSADPPSSSSTATHSHANVQVMVRSINFVDEAPSNSRTIASNKQQGSSNRSASIEKGTEVTDAATASWRDLLDNPKEWKDNRENKRNGLVKPKFPDFKRKDGALSLWLDSAPKWVLSELEGLQFDVPIQKSKQVSQHKGDGSWKDLVENPKKWWDNRLDKLNGKKNKRYPDFKHKETGEALWLSDSPVWVEPKLPSLDSKSGSAIRERDRMSS